METLLLSQYTKRGEDLLEEVRQAFRNMNLDDSSLPSQFLSDDSSIKLVFIGQYSAGKSSIIKMLTGEDVAIGAQITTQQSKPYVWNGLEIVDTPGIHTGLREDHDAITYEEINHAALLVFVITNEGFADQIGKHFRKLAIDQKRANNMVLVVNKMDRSEQGNTPEQQEIIAEDLKKVIDPYTPESLYLSFLDTNSYFESLSEDDPEFRQALLDQSGHDVFVHNLNEFVKAHNITAKLERPLYEIEGALQKAIEKQSSIDGSLSLDGTEELLKRQIRTIRSNKTRLEKMTESTILNYTGQISALGGEMAREISTNSTEGVLNASLKEKEQMVQQLMQQCESEVTQMINDAVSHMEDEIQGLIESQFAGQVQVVLNNDKSFDLAELDEASTAMANPDEEGTSTFDTVKAFSEKIGSMATKSGEGVSAMGLLSGSTKMAEFSGTAVHGAVKSVGSLLGVKFAPWQAVSITKGLATFASVIGIVGSLYSIYSAFQSKEKQKEISEKLKTARREVQIEFDRISETMRSEMMNSVQQYIQGAFDTAIADREQKLGNIKQLRVNAYKNSEYLQTLLGKEQVLMQDIQDNR